MEGRVARGRAGFLSLFLPAGTERYPGGRPKERGCLLLPKRLPSRRNLGLRSCRRGVLAAAWRQRESRVAEEQVGCDAETVTVTRLVPRRLSRRSTPALTASSWPRWPAPPLSRRHTISGVVYFLKTLGFSSPFKFPDVSMMRRI